MVRIDEVLASFFRAMSSAANYVYYASAPPPSPLSFPSAHATQQAQPYPGANVIYLQTQPGQAPQPVHFVYQHHQLPLGHVYSPFEPSQASDGLAVVGSNSEIKKAFGDANRDKKVLPR